jgi:hypothetical protein
LGDEIELNATTKAQDSASCVLVDQAIQTFLFDEENGKWFVEGKKRAVL